MQRIQENPPRFRTTYQGHHTCKVYPSNSQILIGSSKDHEDSSVLLSFNSSNYHQPYVHSFHATYEQETNKKDISSNCFYSNVYQSQPSSWFRYCQPSDDGPIRTTLSPRYPNVDQSQPSRWSSYCQSSDDGSIRTTLSSGSSDHRANDSSCTTNCSLEMDMMLGSIEFEDLILLDFWLIDFSPNSSYVINLSYIMLNRIHGKKFLDLTE